MPVSLDDVSMVVTDTPKMLAEVPAGIPGVALSDLPAMASVPAIDVQTANPIGWKAVPEAPLLPQATLFPESPAPRALRRAHHVADWTGAASDPSVRAGVLAAAAATGGVISVSEGGSELRSCLGPQLYALVTDRDRIASANDHERESISISMRRAALRDHSARARLSQFLSASGQDLLRLPLVSVLVPTRRPERLHQVVATVAAQTYPRVELVLGLHGEGFDAASVNKHLCLNLPAQAVPVPKDQPLGNVLNRALDVAQGSLIAKFDDDDLYGAEHLWDLVLAAEYSNASLVGKVSEYVYLAGADCTIRRFVGFGERYIDPGRSSVAGATALVRRAALEAVGGWRSQGVGEDKALVGDIAADGGDIYRTHGAGFLAMRHGQGHTWEVEDAYFLQQAQDHRSGCDRHFAGIS
ncbi:MAG: glycosyltransferase family 2 protein [Acidimicrobiaceae bacterium]|nr:glycosyltransferase family 2 protein [Acidimicrobiaceae bacterium]MDE0497077.1 glycosyltransferase family 2 protein [Acidimicrobiaceae bacterium]